MAAIDADRAKALVGTPFRPQGRNRSRGLDCVGAVLAACDLPADGARRDYRLRGTYGDELRAALGKRFRPVAPRLARVGDVMLMRVAHDQWHLAILTAGGFIHADARLRRVVETPGRSPWPTRYWRKRSRNIGGR